MTAVEHPKRTVKDKLAHAARDLWMLRWYMLATTIMGCMLATYCGVSAYAIYLRGGHLIEVILLIFTGATVGAGLPTITFAWSRTKPC